MQDATAKGKPIGTIKPHFNPLSNPGLFDFREAVRDKSNSLKWSEDAGRGNIELTATLKGEEPKAQVGRILRFLTFYQPDEERR
jgi:hypothetical protein